MNDKAKDNRLLWEYLKQIIIDEAILSVMADKLTLDGEICRGVAKK